MSDHLARGWDRPSDDGGDPRGVHLRSDQPLTESNGREPVLCAYHAQVTEHLSSFHAGQIARQCPGCVSAFRDATNSLV